MIPIPVACATLLILAGLPGASDELGSLTKKYVDQLNLSWSEAKSDADRGLRTQKLAEKFRAKAWKLVRKRAKAKDADAVWRFALQLDRDAGAKDLAKHARSYLKKRKTGGIRPYAALLLAIESQKGAKGKKADEIIRGFDAAYKDSVLERGQLRVAVAESAVERGDIARAQKLYAEAIALPKSEKELAQEKANYGSSWHKWWAARRDTLDLFKKDWSQLGGTDLDGKSWTVADYYGQVLIIDYWASW